MLHMVPREQQQEALGHYLKKQAGVEALDCSLTAVPLAQMDLPIPSTAQKLDQRYVPGVNDFHRACNALQCEVLRTMGSLIRY